MDRSSAIPYLAEAYRDVTTDAGFSSQNVTDAFNGAIDNALRMLGYTEDVLSITDVPQNQIRPYLALLEYYALKRFIRLYSLRFNVSITGAVSASRNQTFDALKQLLAEAEADCARLGYPVGGLPYFELGRLTLDYLEPTGNTF